MEENHILACEFGLEIDYRWAYRTTIIPVWRQPLPVLL